MGAIGIGDGCMGAIGIGDGCMGAIGRCKVYNLRKSMLINLHFGSSYPTLTV